MQRAFANYAVQQGWPDATVTTVRATEFLTEFFVCFLREHGYHLSSSYYNNLVSALHDLYKDCKARCCGPCILSRIPRSLRTRRGNCEFRGGGMWVALRALSLFLWSGWNFGLY